MANDNKTKKEQEADLRTFALLDNSMGLSPFSVGFQFTNADIERGIQNALENAGIDLDGQDKVYVYCRMNKKFMNEMRKNRKSDAVPFTTEIFVKFGKNDGVKNNSGDDGVKLSRIIKRLNLQGPDAAQFTLLDGEKDTITRAVASLVDGKVKWKVRNKKKNVVSTTLSFDLVLSYCFNLDTTPYKYVVDFADMRDWKRGGFTAYMIK